DGAPFFSIAPAPAKGGADDVFLLLHGADAANVEAHRSVELERLATRRRFRIAEHYTNLLAQLVDEDYRRLRPRDCTRQLAKRLAHEPRLQADVRVSHVTLDLG